jgi:hypothetical protein
LVKKLHGNWNNVPQKKKTQEKKKKEVFLCSVGGVGEEELTVKKK